MKLFSFQEYVHNLLHWMETTVFHLFFPFFEALISISFSRLSILSALNKGFQVIGFTLTFVFLRCRKYAFYSWYLL